MAEHQASFTWGAGPQSVYIAGGFNDWSATATPLIKQPDGSFQVNVPVPWGSKQAYKYIVDGEWMVREDEPKEYDAARNHNNIYMAPEGPSSTTAGATGASTTGASTTGASTTGAAAAGTAATTGAGDLAAREPGSPIKDLAGDAPATTTSGAGSGIVAGVAGAASAAAGALGLGAYAAHKNNEAVEDKPLAVGTSAADPTGNATSRAAGTTTTGTTTTGATTTGATTTGAAAGQSATAEEPGAPIKDLANDGPAAPQSSSGIAGGAAALAGAAAGALGLGAYAANKPGDAEKDSTRLGAGLHTGEPGATPFVATPTGQHQPGDSTGGIYATTGPADGTTGDELGGPKVTNATPATGTASAFSGGMPNLTGSSNEPAVPRSGTAAAGSGLSPVGSASQFNATVAEAKDAHNNPQGSGLGAGTAAAAGAGAAALGAGTYAASREHDKATTGKDAQIGQSTDAGAHGQSLPTDRSATDSSAATGHSATGLSAGDRSATGPTGLGASTTGSSTTGPDARDPGQAAVAHGQSLASTDVSRHTDDQTRSTTSPDIPDKSTQRSSGPGAGALAAAGSGAAALGAGTYAATRGNDDDHLSKSDSAKIQAQALYADSTKSAQAQPSTTGPTASSQAPAGHGSPLDRTQEGEFAGHTTQGISTAQADRDRFGAADRGEYSSKVNDYLGKEKEEPPSGFAAATAAAKKEWTEERAEGHGIGESAVAAGTAGAAALGYGKQEGKFSAPLPPAPMAGKAGTGAPGESFATTGADKAQTGTAGQDEGISGKALALGAGAAGALGAAGASLYALAGGKPEPISIDEAKARGIEPSSLPTQDLTQAGSGTQPPEGAVQDLQEIVDGLKKDGTAGATGAGVGSGAGVGAVDSARSAATVPGSTGQTDSGISGAGAAGAAAGAGALGAAAAGAASLLHKDTDFVSLILGHPAQGVTETTTGSSGSPLAAAAGTAGSTGAPGAPVGSHALDKSTSFAAGSPGQTAPGTTGVRDGQDQGHGHGLGSGAAAAAAAGAAALGAGAYAASRKDKDGRDIHPESRDLPTGAGAGAGVPAGAQSFAAQPASGDRSDAAQTGAYSSKVSEYVNQSPGASTATATGIPGQTSGPASTATATGIPGQTSGPGAANIAQSQSFAAGAPSDAKDLAARDTESRSGPGAGTLAGAGALGAAALGAGAYAATRDKDGKDIASGATGTGAPGQGQQFSATGSTDATRDVPGATGPGATVPSAIPEAKASQLLAASAPGVVTASEEGRMSGQSTDNEGSEGSGRTKTEAQRARDKAKKARQKAKKRAAAAGTTGEDEDQTDITSVSNSGYVTPNVVGESDAEGASRTSSAFGPGAVAGGLGAAGLGAGAAAALAKHRDSNVSTRAIPPDTPREGLGLPGSEVAPKDATSFDSSVDDRGFAASTTAQDVEREYKQFAGHPSSENRERELTGAGLGADTIQGRDTLTSRQPDSHAGRNAALGGAAGLGAGAAAVGAASALHKDSDRDVSDLSAAPGGPLPEGRDVAGALPEGRDFASGGQQNLTVPGSEFASAGPATGTTGTPETSRELPTDREHGSYGTALGAGAAGLGAAALGAGAYAASRRDGNKDGIPATDISAANYPSYGTASGIGLGTTGTAATGQAHAGAPGHHESIGTPGSPERSPDTTGLKGSSSVGRIVSPSGTGPVRDASGSPLTDTRDLAAATGHPGTTSSHLTSPAETTQLAPGVPAEIKDTFGDSARDASGTGHAYGTGVGAPEKEHTDDRHSSGLGAAALGAGAAGTALGAGAYAASRRDDHGQDERERDTAGLTSQPGVPAASPGEFARGSQSHASPLDSAAGSDGKYSAKVDEYLADAPGTKQHREAETSGKYSSSVAQYASGGEVGREGALSSTQGVSAGATDASRDGHGLGAGTAAAAGAGAAALGAGAYAASRGRDDTSASHQQRAGEGTYSTKVDEYLAEAPGTQQHRDAETSGKYSSGVEQYVSPGGKNAQGLSTGPTDTGREGHGVGAGTTAAAGAGAYTASRGTDDSSALYDKQREAQSGGQYSTAQYGGEGKDAQGFSTGPTDTGRDGREGHGFGAGTAAAAGAGAAALGAGAYAASRGQADTSAPYDKQSGSQYPSTTGQYGGEGKEAVSGAQGFSTAGPTDAPTHGGEYSSKVDEYLAGAPGTRQHRDAETSGKYSSSVAQYASGAEGKDAISDSQGLPTGTSRDGHGLGAGTAAAGVGAAALGAGAYAASRGNDETHVPASAQNFATGPTGLSQTGGDSLSSGAGVSGPTAGDRFSTTGANIPVGQQGKDSQFADAPRDTDTRDSGLGAGALGAGAAGAAALGAGAYAASRRDDKTHEFGSDVGQPPHSGGALGEASRDAKAFDRPTAGGVPTTGAAPGSNFSTTGPGAAGIAASGVPSSTSGVPSAATDFARTATPGTSASAPPVDKAAERATDAGSSSQDTSGFAKPALAAAAGLGAVGAGGAILANKLDQDVQKFQGTDEQGRPVFAALAQQTSPTGEVTAIAGAASGKDYEERMTMERVTGPGGETRTLMADEIRTAKGTGMTAVEQIEYPSHTQTLIAQQDPSGEITTTLAQTGPQGTTIQRTNEPPVQPVSGPEHIGGPPGAGTPTTRSTGGSVDSYDTALSGDHHFDNEKTPTIPQNEQHTGSGISPAAYGAGAAAAGLAVVGAGAAYAHSKNQQPQTQQFQQQPQVGQFQQQSQAGQFIQPSQQQRGQQGQYSQQPSIDTGLHPGQVAGQGTQNDSAIGAGKGGSAFIEPSPSKYTSGGLPQPQYQAGQAPTSTSTSGAGTAAGVGALAGASAAGLAGRDGDSRQHPSVRGESSVSAADTSAPLSTAEAREGVQLGPGPEALSSDQRHSSQTFGAPDSLERQDKSGAGYAAPIAAGVGAVGAGAAAAGLYGASHGQTDAPPEQNAHRASNREAFISGVPTQAKSGNFLAGVPGASEGQQGGYAQQVRGYGDQAVAGGQSLSQQGQGFVGQAGQQAQGYTDKAGQFVSSPSGATAPGEKDGKSGLPFGGMAAGVGAAAIGAGAAAAHYGAGGRDTAQTKLEGVAPGQAGAGSVPPPAPVDAPTPTTEAPKTPTKERRRSSLFGSMFKKKDRERLQNMETESMPQDAASNQAAARAKLESSATGPAGSGLPAGSTSTPTDAQGNRVSGLPGAAGAAGAGMLAAGTGLAAGALATGKSGVDSGSNTLTSGIDTGRAGVTNGLESGRNTVTSGLESGRTAGTGAFDSGRNTLTGGLDSGRAAATGTLGGVTGAVGGAGSKLGMGPESGRTGASGSGAGDSAAGFAQKTMDSATGLGTSTFGTASGMSASAIGAGRDSTGKVLDAGAKHASLLPGTGAGVAGVRASTPTGSRLSAPPGSVGPSTPTKTPHVPEPTTPAAHSTHTTESGRRKKRGLFQRIKEALTGKKHDHERL